MMIIKSRGGSRNWGVYHKDIGLNMLKLNSDAAQDTGASAVWGGSHPTSTVFSIGDASESGKSETYVAYCFANCEGYIKAGSYVGNANDNGAFLYLGFKPAFFMCKPIVAGNWRMQDNKRTPFNVANKTLYPNHDNAEESNDSNDIDLLSNGVKMRASDSNYNQATTFVYLAMAENPFQYATAR